jgi:hypothetical protein
LLGYGLNKFLGHFRHLFDEGELQEIENDAQKDRDANAEYKLRPPTDPTPRQFENCGEGHEGSSDHGANVHDTPIDVFQMSRARGHVGHPSTIGAAAGQPQADNISGRAPTSVGAVHHL